MIKVLFFLRIEEGEDERKSDFYSRNIKKKTGITFRFLEFCSKASSLKGRYCQGKRDQVPLDPHLVHSQPSMR